MNNRIHNATNPNQGPYKRILCVCSAGLLRSPTMAFVLSQLGHNSRAAGSSPDFALIPVDEVLIEWADQIVFVNKENHDALKHRFDLKRVDCLILDIPDKYKYRDPELMKICEEQYTKANNNE
jgi:predicted protein tyrosine phosphatase